MFFFDPVDSNQHFYYNCLVYYFLHPKYDNRFILILDLSVTKNLVRNNQFSLFSVWWNISPKVSTHQCFGNQSQHLEKLQQQVQCSRIESQSEDQQNILPQLKTKMFNSQMFIQARIAQLAAFWLGTREVPGSNPCKSKNF